MRAPAVPPHRVPGAEHQGPLSPPPVQQGWPAAPQVAHAPLAQVPPFPPHAVPAATHAPCDPQHPPLAQVLPPQQGSPAAPQCAHMLLAAQNAEASRQEYFPRQHACPIAPQVAHAPFEQAPRFPPQVVPLATHTRPVPQHAEPEQVPPGQQGSPALPQAAQIPPRQAVFSAVQVFPEQHGPPAAPHVPHAPALQVPLPTGAPQAMSAPTQMPFTQQPAPPAQTLLSQQICPLPPHATPLLVVDPDPHPIIIPTMNSAKIVEEIGAEALDCCALIMFVCDRTQLLRHRNSYAQ